MSLLRLAKGGRQPSSSPEVHIESIELAKGNAVHWGDSRPLVTVHIK